MIIINLSTGKLLIKIINVLMVREMTKPNVKKFARKLRDYHQDSICRTGEAIGATAGACIGEPATQAALRTFHFAGKMTVQGSIDRLKQILESPITTDENNHAPNTILRILFLFAISNTNTHPTTVTAVMIKNLTIQYISIFFR